MSSHSSFTLFLCTMTMIGITTFEDVADLLSFVCVEDGRSLLPCCRCAADTHSPDLPPPSSPHMDLPSQSPPYSNVHQQFFHRISCPRPSRICQNIWALRGKLTRLIILVITFDILMSYLQINILYSYPAISSRLDLVHTHPSFVVTRSNTAREF